MGTIESGPASGVVGTRFLGELIGEDNILATDMGGTTFKVGVPKRFDREQRRELVLQHMNPTSLKIRTVRLKVG